MSRPRRAVKRPRRGATAGATADDDHAAPVGVKEEEEEEAGAGAGAGAGVDSGDEGDKEEEEDDDDDDDDDEEAESEVPLEPKVLPKRITRGLRVNTLVGEAAEADEVFWGQQAFQEEGESEDEFTSQPPSTDSSDSDISNSEPEPDDGPVKDVEPAREAPKKKQVYVDPATLRRRKRARAAARAAAGGAAVGTAKRRSAAATVQPTDRSLRASTNKRSEQRQARAAAVAVAEEQQKVQRAAARAAVKAATRDPRPSQRQVLVEAARTAVENQAALAAMLRLEEAKKAEGVGSGRARGPRVMYHAKLGATPTVTFTDVDHFPAVINAKAEPYPERAVCVITGQPARYLDPVTRQPFANAAAFKELRRQHEAATRALNEREGVAPTVVAAPE